MRLLIEDLGRSRNELIDRAVEEVVCYIDCEEYLEKELKLYVDRENEDEDMRADEYMFYSFSIWREIYKRVPEFLMFVESNILTEIFLSYLLHSKANSSELIEYSYAKALERGVPKEILDARMNEYKPLLPMV